MEPLTIIISFNVGEQVTFGRLAGCIGGMVDEFGLEGMEPAFHRRIVPAIAPATHAADDSVLGQDALEITNDLTIPWNAHTFTVGTSNEFGKFSNLFVRNPFGTYEFAVPDGESRYGYTVNCSSGLQAIAMAAERIMAGMAEQIIAGISDADGFGSVAEVQAYLAADVAGEDGVEVTKRYRFHRGSYKIDVGYEVANRGDKPLAPHAYFQFVRDANLDDVKDLVLYTPGLTGNSKDSYIDILNIRGVITNDFGVGGDPSISVFKNGLYQGRTGAAAVIQPAACGSQTS